MKRFILSGLSVLLVATAVTPVLATTKATGTKIGAITSELKSNPPAEVPSPSLFSLDPSSARLTSANPTLQAVSPTPNQTKEQEKKTATGLSVQQEIAMIVKTKGQFGGGDQLRRYFFGDLEPISVQPGGAGMVVNLYNKANNVTFAYCATYDVVVAVKPGRVTAFLASEVK